MNKNEVISLLKELGFKPNKKLGQNFLIDNNIINQKIIPALELSASRKILEIGPGLGALTKILLEESKELTLIEIDKGFANYLKNKFPSRPNLKIIQQDFLKVSVGDRYEKIVSNLPYYCASEIIFKLATEYQQAKDIFLTIQKEMAERIIALPNQKMYGALTVNLNFYFEPKILFIIKKKSFYPEPEVDSAFIKLSRRKKLLLPLFQRTLFHKVVKALFWGRRKTILTSLANSPHLEISKNQIIKKLDKINLDHKLRAENLTLKNFIDITQEISHE